MRCWRPGCPLSKTIQKAYAFDLSLPILAVVAQLLQMGEVDLQLAPPLADAGRLRLNGVETRNLTLLSMNATASGFADQSLDCVVTSFLLDVISEPTKLIEEIHRILVPGGVWVNYGPTGPRNALWHFDRSELSDLACSLGFELLQHVAHRTTLFAFGAEDSDGAWSSHMCHLTLFRAGRADSCVLSRYPSRIGRRPWMQERYQGTIPPPRLNSNYPRGSAQRLFFDIAVYWANPSALPSIRVRRRSQPC